MGFEQEDICLESSFILCILILNIRPNLKEISKYKMRNHQIINTSSMQQTA
jgi:hypothetical protein